jgi:hypothetical protein
MSFKDIGMTGEWVTTGHEALESGSPRQSQSDQKAVSFYDFHPDRLEDAGYGWYSRLPESIRRS